MVYFRADWAAPCTQMAAVHDTLRRLHADSLAFRTVDVDANSWVVAKLSIEHVPCTLLVAGGRTVERIDGAHAVLLTRRTQWLVNASVLERLDASVRHLMHQADVVVFMKGTPEAPRCGFSRQMVEVLQKAGIDFRSVDVLADEDVRGRVKVLADWPTFPQLYAHGHLVGGIDIARALGDANNLGATIEKAGDWKLQSNVDIEKSFPAQDNAPVVATVGEQVDTRLKALVSRAPIVLFMKGSPDAPQCGFSRKMVALLKESNVQFGHFDILQDNEVRQGLKKYSNWPTYPQLYANGTLIGGLDIAKELADAGTLRGELGLDAGNGAAVQSKASGQAGKTAEASQLEDRLGMLVAQSSVMLFMKGAPEAPQCGFSRKMVALLEAHSVKFGHFDILQDEQVRQGLKTFSNWPTFPQLYANGTLVGGLDIAKELAEAGALRREVGLEGEMNKEECEAKNDVGDAVALENRLGTLIGREGVMLFMKGAPDAPQCGFSRKMVALLREENVAFGDFDILQDDSVRQGLKKYSNWPTYPQLYANGALVGGLDIAKELSAAGTLRRELGLDAKAAH